ncbi:MAG TPA: hypothetical protein PLH27_08190 [bacterium]|nr:hypothetical protein [bacterium]HMW33305.1 hypothetical protein [bacterium]HMW36442.1 hypothetical protein [bacterium]HMY37259.1 hypothetical protein [bacterium]HMZ04766.1 hypothetical protein [bacterium]
MEIKTNFFIVILLSYNSLSCDGCSDALGFDSRLEVINNSTKKIHFDGGFTYPDTSIGEILSGEDIKPNSQRVFGIQGRWEERFEDLPAETLMIFIFDADTLDQVPWEKVRSEYKILRRYDLSLQDLKDRDWKVVYP